MGCDEYGVGGRLDALHIGSASCNHPVEDAINYEVHDDDVQFRRAAVTDVVRTVLLLPERVRRKRVTYLQEKGSKTPCDS